MKNYKCKICNSTCKAITHYDPPYCVHQCNHCGNVLFIDDVFDYHNFDKLDYTNLQSHIEEIYGDYDKDQSILVIGCPCYLETFEDSDIAKQLTTKSGFKNIIKVPTNKYLD